jgi:peptidoglycan/LPS O-acetylase OafA/YrhL
MTKIPYRPEIDGLRAVSIIGVILFHFWPQVLPGGFMGVDVFFVISGYLISKIILASKHSSDSWLRSFWLRRLQRIFPALAVMVIAVLFLVFLIGVPTLIASTGRQAVAVSTFVSNYRMLSVTGNYWGASTDYVPLLHTWSLAVEEQFYFIYPILLVLAFHFGKFQTTRNVLFAMGAISLLWCVHQTSVASAAAFYLLPSRAWELLAGALIAFYGHEKPAGVSEKVAAFLANAGLILVVAGFIFLPAGARFPGVIALVPVVGAGLYIQFSWARGWSPNLLSTRPALFIGKASYSLYLWHWPMLVLGMIYSKLYEIEGLRAAGLMVGIFLGFASYRWVEPLGRRPNFLKVFFPITAGLLVLGTTTAFLEFNFYSQKYDKDWRGADYDALVERDTPIVVRAFSGLNPGSIQWPHLKNSESASPSVVLLGDSHALSLANQLNILAQKSGNSLAVCAVGGWALAPAPRAISQFDSVRKSFYEKRISLVGKAQPKLIIINARWENVKGDDALNEVRCLIERLHQLSPSSRVIVIGQSPVINYAPNSGIYAHEWMSLRDRMHIGGTTLPASTQPSMQLAHAFLQKVSSENSYVTFIPIDDLFLIKNGKIDVAEDGKILYYDNNHLSEFGAQRVADKIAPVISHILKD